MTNGTDRIKLIGKRIEGMRNILEIPVTEMAELCKLSEEEYLARERGERDITFSFLNVCATRFNLDIAELLTGENAHLKSYAIERKGEGLSVERRAGFDYRHLASRFNNRNIEPFLVTVPYILGSEDAPIKTNTHDGQEMDYILEGTLLVSINGKLEILNVGDTIVYDSALPHGMVAADGKPCKFLALLTK